MRVPPTSTCRAVIFAAVALAASGTLAVAAFVPVEKDLDAELSDRLPPLRVDALSPFSLSLALTPEEVVRRLGSRPYEILGERNDRYLHVSVPELPAATSALPSPEGLRVLDAHLFFAGGRTLTEASLSASCPAGKRQAIERLIGMLGEPEFETVLPGNLELALGWRLDASFLVVSFTDEEVFRINAFRNDPGDLRAGSAMVLFEGLSLYARRVQAGHPRAETEEDFLEVLGWYGVAREVLNDAR